MPRGAVQARAGTLLISLGRRLLLKTVASYLCPSATVKAPHAHCFQDGTTIRFEWLKNLSIVGTDGIVKCSTLPALVGVDAHDRPYFQKAVATRQLVISDYVLGKAYEELRCLSQPIRRCPADPSSSAVLVASVNLKWVEQLMANIGSRNGSEVLMLDGKGVVIGARGRDEGRVGQRYDDQALIDAVASREFWFFYTGTDSEGHGPVDFASRAFPGEQCASHRQFRRGNHACRDRSRDIMAAYLQFAIVSIVRAARRMAGQRAPHYSPDPRHYGNGYEIRPG